MSVAAPDYPAGPHQPDPENRALGGVVRWLVTVILLAER